MRLRKVVVVGNCQALAIANLYRDYVGAPSGESVTYLDDHNVDTAIVRDSVQDADMLLVQQRDFSHRLTAEELRPGIEIHSFPMVLAGFIWPYANEPHVHNKALPPFHDGPYPAQLSDSYLNRLIVKGVSPEDALEQYLALDITKAANVERLFELYLERQQERDAKTGFGLAEVIERDVRTEHLFLTPHHPNARLFGILASQLLESLNVPADAIRLAISSLRTTPFPPHELPIHPGVIKNFGLTFADDTTRYTYFDEGRFTFSEYVLRYMQYENNHDLRMGIFNAGGPEPQAALASLDRGLQRSPRSIRGLRAKGQVLDRLGRHAEAEAAFKLSVGVAPTDPEGFIGLARTLAAAGDMAQAEEAARKAVAVDPIYAPSYHVLADIMLRSGRDEDAVAAAREAARLAPGRANVQSLLGFLLVRIGDYAGAERAYGRALLIEPASADLRVRLADALERLNQRADAIMLLKDGIAEGHRHAETFSALGHMLLRNGNLAESDEVFTQGIALDPDRNDLQDGRARARERLQATIS